MSASAGVGLVRLCAQWRPLFLNMGCFLSVEKLQLLFLSTFISIYPYLLFVKSGRLIITYMEAAAPQPPTNQPTLHPSHHEPEATK